MIFVVKRMNPDSSVRHGSRANRLRPVVLAFAVGVGFVAAALAVAAPPNIGGAPDHTQTDLFSSGGVVLEVHSYVYQGSGAVLPEGMTPSLSAEEAMFVYLVENTGSQDADFLLVTNPDGVLVGAVGSAYTVVPAGYNPAQRRNPDYFFTGWNKDFTNQVIQYGWTAVPKYGLELLHPTEWTAVYCRVQGLANTVLAYGGKYPGAYENNQLPGPMALPEPAALSMLILGLMVWRKRRS